MIYLTRVRDRAPCNGEGTCGPHGNVLLAVRNEDTLLIADCIPKEYGPTHPEGDYLKNRRPELYKDLVAMQAEFDGGYEYKDPPDRSTDL